MEQDNPKLQAFHESLVKSNYGVPDYETFATTLKDPVKSKTFYDALVNDKYEMPDYETFVSDLGLKKKDVSEFGLPSSKVLTDIFSKVAGDIPKLETSSQEVTPETTVQYPHWTDVSKVMGISLPKEIEESGINPHLLGEPKTVGGEKPKEKKIPTLPEIKEKKPKEEIQLSDKTITKNDVREPYLFTIDDYLKKRGVAPETVGLDSTVNTERLIDVDEKVDFDKKLESKGLYKPTPQYKESYFGATVNGLYNGTAKMIRDIGYLLVEAPQQTKTAMIQVGVKMGAKVKGWDSETTKKYMEQVASAIENGAYGNTSSITKEGYEGAAKWLESAVKTRTPNTTWGRALENVGGFVPDLISIGMLPEAKAPLLVKWGLQGMLKFPAYLGVKTYVEGAREGKKVKDIITTSAEAAVQGMVFNGLGVWAHEIGNITKSVGAGMWASRGTEILANSLGFGGITAVQGGEAEQGLLEGLAFSALGAPRMIKEGMQKKAMLNWMTATNNNIRMIAAQKIDPFKLRQESNDLWEKAQALPDGEQKDHLLWQKTTVDNTIDIAFMSNQILKNPQAFIQSINENPILSAKEKKVWTNKVNETVNLTDPRILESQPMTENIKNLESELTYWNEKIDVEPDLKASKIEALQNQIKEQKDARIKIFSKPLEEKIKEKPQEEPLQLGGKTFADKTEMFTYLNETAVDKKTGKPMTGWMEKGMKDLPNSTTLKVVNEWLATKTEKPKSTYKTETPKEKIRRFRTTMFKKGSRSHKAVNTTAENFDDAVMQYFIAGGKVSKEDFIRYSGWGEKDIKKAGLGFLLSKTGMKMDVFNEAVENSFGIEEKGPMDMINAVVEVMKNNPTRGQMLTAFEKRHKMEQPFEPTEEEITKQENDEKFATIIKNNGGLNGKAMEEAAGAGLVSKDELETFKEELENENTERELEAREWADEEARIAAELESEGGGKEVPSGEKPGEGKTEEITGLGQDYENKDAVKRVLIETAVDNFGFTKKEHGEEYWNNAEMYVDYLRKRTGTENDYDIGDPVLYLDALREASSILETIDKSPSMAIETMSKKSVAETIDFLKSQLSKYTGEDRGVIDYRIKTLENYGEFIQEVIDNKIKSDEGQIQKPGITEGTEAGNKLPGGTETGKEPVTPEGKEKPVRTTDIAKQGKIDAINKNIDGWIAEKQKALAENKKAMDKAVAEAQMRPGLFGDTKETPEAKIFTSEEQGFALTPERLKEIELPFREKEAELNKNIASLEKQRESSIGEVLKQQTMGFEETPIEKTPEEIKKETDFRDKMQEIIKDKLDKLEPVKSELYNQVDKAVIESGKGRKLSDVSDLISKAIDSDQLKTLLEHPFVKRYKELTQQVYSKLQHIERHPELYEVQKIKTAPEGIEYKGKRYTDIEQVQDDFTEGRLTFKEQNEVLEKVRKFEDGLKNEAKKISDDIAKIDKGAKDTEDQIKKDIDDKNSKLFLKFFPDFWSALGTVQWKIFSPIRDKLANVIAGQLKKGVTTQTDGLRWSTKVLTNLYNGLLRTQADMHGAGLQGQVGKLEMSGAKEYGKYKARQLLDTWRAMVNGDWDSLNRVWSVLDPKLATKPTEKPLTYGDLGLAEKNLYFALKEWMTWGHETTYANGLIPTKTYLKYKDVTGSSNYIARMYDKFEMDILSDPAIQEFANRGNDSYTSKIASEIYKMRKELNGIVEINGREYDSIDSLKEALNDGEITKEQYADNKDAIKSDEWRREHAIKDPTYLVAKRVYQTIRNVAVKQYMDAVIANHPEYVLTIPKKAEIPKGFRRMSSSYAWGPFRNKVVASHIIEDLTGFFYQNEIVNTTYDVMKLMNRTKLSQFYKKFRTVYNPFVQLGNATGDVFFATINGLNPFSFVKGMYDNYNIPKNNPILYEKLLKAGYIGPVAMTGEMKPLDVLNPKQGIYGKFDEWATGVYVGTDNLAKISAYQIYRRQGLSHEQALRRGYDAFQNYATVGKTWDLASKTPLIGPTFVKFQADLQRILVNSMLTTPLTTIGTFMIIKMLGNLSSALSGETEEEQAIRENRKGVPRIPFVNIPLSFKVGKAELNVARYISPVYLYNRGDSEMELSELSKFLPFQFQQKEQDKPFPMPAFADATWGWLGSVLTDKDFRGMSIWDPKRTEYTDPNTPGDVKWFNALNYIARSQIPFYKGTADIIRGATGQLDYYGRKRTWYQAILNNIIKIQQFDKPEIKNYVEHNLDYLTSRFASYSTMMGDAQGLFYKTLKEAEDKGLDKESQDKIYKSASKLRDKSVQKSLTEMMPIFQEIEQKTSTYKKWYPNDKFIEENYKNIESGKVQRFNVLDMIDFQKNHKEEYLLLKKNNMLKTPEMPKYYRGVALTDEEKKKYSNIYWSEYIRQLDLKVGLTQEEFDEYKTRLSHREKADTPEGIKEVSKLEDIATMAASQARSLADRQFQYK